MLRRGGPADHHPVGDPPDLPKKGWKIFHRGARQRRRAGPGRRLYIKNALRREKVFVIDDASEYGKGLADEVVKIAGSAVVGRTRYRPTAEQTDFSATVTKVKAAAPTRSSSAATTPRPACSSSSCATPASTATVRRR